MGLVMLNAVRWGSKSTTSRTFPKPGMPMTHSSRTKTQGALDGGRTVFVPRTVLVILVSYLDIRFACNFPKLRDWHDWLGDSTFDIDYK